MIKAILLFLVSTLTFAQDLINFQHQLFCVPTKSTIINSLNIIRIGQSISDWPYHAEKIKAKLIYDDYFEIVASGYEEIKFENHPTNSSLVFSNSGVSIQVITSKQIWRNTIHQMNLLAYIKQNRFQTDEAYIELKCISQLSQI